MMMMTDNLPEAIFGLILRQKRLNPSKALMQIIHDSISTHKTAYYVSDIDLFYSLEDTAYKATVSYALLLQKNPVDQDSEILYYFKEVVGDIIVTTKTSFLAEKLPFNTARSYIPYLMGQRKILVEDTLYDLDPNQHQFIYQEVYD